MTPKHLENVPPIILELVEAGVEVKLTKKGYQICGIGKIGSVTLTARNGQGGTFPSFESPYIAVDDRYGKSYDIHETTDVVRIVDDWWESKPECGFGDGWKELLIKFGYAFEDTRPVLRRT